MTAQRYGDAYVDLCEGGLERMVDSTHPLPVWERFYVAISRNRALLHRPKRPKSESPIRRYHAEAALNGPVTDRRACFTRRFRAVRVRHASIRPHLSRPRGVGSKLRAVPEPQNAF